ncbi:hypothetical protein C2E31_18610 [Rhodopirellula baltica]|nr:hypothetical protein C2E31_18610 [Rhodopirellula baltica]
MSIKRLACPGCGNTVNVPASMAKTRCPSCNLVFSTQNPTAPRSTTANSGPKRTQSNQDADSGSESKMMQWVIALGVAFVAMLVLIVITFFRVGRQQEEAKQAEAVAAEQRAVAEQEAKKICNTVSSTYPNRRGSRSIVTTPR